MRVLSIVDTRKVYDWVFGIYAPIGIGVIVLFTILIVGAVVAYRPNATPSRRHEANTLELGYALLLTCVAAFLLYVTFTAEHRVDTASANERPAVTIEVTGSRWEWAFGYPGHGITHESGAVGDQPLVVPANEPVRFKISSQDVIHSFWIPQLRFKRDAIPGSTQVVTLAFDRTGRFRGSCAEFCGLLHADMVFSVDVLTPRAFKAWLTHMGSAAA